MTEEKPDFLLDVVVIRVRGWPKPAIHPADGYTGSAARPPAHGWAAQALDNAAVEPNRFAVKPYSKGIRVILWQELAICGKFRE
jgi:hypothetical protein